MIFKIRSIRDGYSINFIDDDDGERLDEIEVSLKRALGLTRVKTAGNPLEEVQLLKGTTADFALTWDGYLTELRILRGNVHMVDVFNSLEDDKEFSV